MRIVVAHNRYKFAGGEDSVMRAEVEMLRGAGHEVALLEADNRTIEGTRAKIAAAGSLFHSSSSAQRMRELIRSFRPEVVHVHNWFPLLSPSIVSAAAGQGVPVVQTLHNFRMVCANATLFRGGRICDDCVGRAVPLGALLHGCYAASRTGSALVSAAFSYHRAVGTWEGVSVFIALTEFQRRLLVRGGVDAAKTVVKPNFVRDSGDAGAGSGGYALFAGRLTPEKGIRTVLRTWEENAGLPPLKIMGDGPLADEVRERATRARGVEYLGQQSSEEVRFAMGEAQFLVFPSECHEAFGLSIVEAFSRGTPVLGTDLEPVAEMVKDGETGLLFAPGDAADLAAKAVQIMADPARYQAMRRRCREVYAERYSEVINYQILMDIYTRAIAVRHGHSIFAARPLARHGHERTTLS